MQADISSPVISASSTPVDTRENGLQRLQEKARSGQFTLFGPLLACFIRFPLLLACFLLVFACLQVTGHSQPAGLAQAITQYNLTPVVDLVTLFLLVWLTRKEGMRLRDLLCWTRKFLFRDLVKGIGLLFLIYTLFAVIAVLTILFFSSSSFFTDPSALADNLGINPLGLPAQLLISMIVLPLSAAFTEEMAYRGYVQPRLQVLTGRKWLAILIMATGFGLQHVVFGLSDWRLALAGFLATVISGLCFGLFYLLTRQRLLPLIILHWQVDLFSIGLIPLLLTHILR